MFHKFHWPLGFSAAGTAAGVSYKKGKKDMALFLSNFPAHGAALFTASRVKAAPLIYTQKAILNTRGLVRAVVVNSGSANAATGPQGYRDALETAKWASRGLKLPMDQVWLSSTGVIGPRIKLKNYRKGLKSLLGALRNAGTDEVRSAAEAILTTDTIPKVASAVIKIGGVPVTIWGCCKGSGMIHPVLRGPHGELHATMLGFILTDASIKSGPLQWALEYVADKTFNCVSIDGDTSTNDFVALLANGASGSPEIKGRRTKDYHLFREGLFKVCDHLVDLIALDGEGASRLVQIFVEGARSEKSARSMASVIASSPLVKTAVHGADPNWGRILAAMGRSGVPFEPRRVKIWIGDTLVCKGGMEVPFSDQKVIRYMRNKRIFIRVHLGLGPKKSQYRTCDFTGQYVGINAGYRT